VNPAISGALSRVWFVVEMGLPQTGAEGQGIGPVNGPGRAFAAFNNLLNAESVTRHLAPKTEVEEKRVFI
jgi:hypothetical protein